MGGDSISNSVNRVFKVIGLIFIFGGIYTGIFVISNIPDVISVSGTVNKISVKRQRPLGFENIPVETDNPEYDDFPLYIRTTLSVTYEYDRKKYSSNVFLDGESGNINKGMEIPLFIISEEPDIPYINEPVNTKKELQNSIIIMSAMSLMGLALFLVSLFSVRSALNNQRKEIETLKEKIERIHLEREKGTDIITRNKSGGSILIGIIMTLLGAVLTLSMANMLFFENGFSLEMKFEFFPFILGIGLLYIGLCEFNKNIIIIYSDRVFIEKRNIISRSRVEVDMNEFLGIGEYITATVRESRVKREIYHEHYLYHENTDISGIVFAKLPDNDDYRGKINKISEILKMPLVLFDNDEIRLDYPDSMKQYDDVKKEIEDPFKRSYASQRDFRSKYLKILYGQNDFAVERSYKTAILWGLGVFATGAALSILSRSAVIMLPLGMIGAIFTGIGLKRDLLYITEGEIVLELYFAGRIYSRKKIMLGRIENIISGSDIRRNMADSLQILSDSDEILFGQALKHEELEWIKDKILEYVHKYRN